MYPRRHSVRLLRKPGVDQRTLRAWGRQIGQRVALTSLSCLQNQRQWTFRYSGLVGDVSGCMEGGVVWRHSAPLWTYTATSVWQPAGHNFLHKWPIIGRVDEQRAAPYGGKWAELESANREGGLVLVSDIEEEPSPSRTADQLQGFQRNCCSTSGHPNIAVANLYGSGENTKQVTANYLVLPGRLLHEEMEDSEAQRLRGSTGRLARPDSSSSFSSSTSRKPLNRPGNRKRDKRFKNCYPIAETQPLIGGGGGGGGLWGLAAFDLRKSTAVRRLTVRAAGAANVDVATTLTAPSSSEGGRSREWPLRRGGEERGSGGASPSHLDDLPGRLSSRSRSGAAPMGLRVGGPASMSEWLSGGMESEGSSLGGRDVSPGKRRRKEAHGQTAYRCHSDSAADINHSKCGH
ncbi:hypothetical protein EYF80_017860 [Liparis tanakae]|uniref:Uncharacterized protein n=1 Tax=Liparis tanakae TaxID=230148 RepID=A0A4Z2I3N9_9TELE|nr:hypothetical protein EYF80_017860 [Liparis tanakae]